MTKKEILILAALAVLVLGMAVAVAVTAGTSGPAVIAGEFVPPSFDAQAVAGTPGELESRRGYGTLTLQKDAVVSLCANVYMEGSDALLYLTAHEGNAGWIRVKILDAQGQVLGQSGLLRPGQYVRAVPLEQVPEAGTILTVKILIYEPDTYYSLGSAGAQIRIAGPETN